MEEQAKKKQIEVSLFEDLNLVFDIKGNNFVAFNLLDLNPKLATSIEHFKNFQRFKIDSRLLKRALLGPHLANWNNIEIGAHLSFSRKPDVL